MSSNRDLPAVTIVIEWENAIDVEDEWTARAMSALERELDSVSARFRQRPRVTYLYDSEVVDPQVIRSTIESFAPRLSALAELEIVPAPGLTYYQLKNFGISRAATELAVMLDSDAAPQPGWLEGLLKPFEDPDVMVVGGFTVLGHEDLLSKTMALSWIFDLPDERQATVERHKVHANNCAVRTGFFRANPFPDLPVFKKQCGFWLRDISARGVRYVRTADAMTVHAPHPGYRFLLWRAWTTGTDRDYQIYQEKSRSRVGRVAHALAFAAKKTRRSWSRIISKGSKVDLPVWQRPAAMAIGLGYYGVAAVAAIGSALTRRHEPLPARPKPEERKLGAAG